MFAAAFNQLPKPMIPLVMPRSYCIRIRYVAQPLEYSVIFCSEAQHILGAVLCIFLFPSVSRMREDVDVGRRCRSTTWPIHHPTSTSAPTAVPTSSVTPLTTFPRSSRDMRGKALCSSCSVLLHSISYVYSYTRPRACDAYVRGRLCSRGHTGCLTWTGQRSRRSCGLPFRTIRSDQMT